MHSQLGCVQTQTPSERLGFVWAVLYQAFCTHQMCVHSIIFGRGHKHTVLHQADEAPKCLDLILHDWEDWGEQVGHALVVANGWIEDGVIQQDVPGRDQVGDGEFRHTIM